MAVTKQGKQYKDEIAKAAQLRGKELATNRNKASSAASETAALNVEEVEELAQKILTFQELDIQSLRELDKDINALESVSDPNGP